MGTIACQIDKNLQASSPQNRVAILQLHAKFYSTSNRAEGYRRPPPPHLSLSVDSVSLCRPGCLLWDLGSLRLRLASPTSPGSPSLRRACSRFVSSLKSWRSWNKSSPMNQTRSPKTSRSCQTAPSCSSNSSFRGKPGGPAAPRKPIGLEGFGGLRKVPGFCRCLFSFCPSASLSGSTSRTSECPSLPPVLWPPRMPGFHIRFSHLPGPFAAFSPRL